MGRARFLKTTRRSLRMRLRRAFSGWTPIHRQRRRSLKRSRRHWRALQCQFFNPWQVELEQEECLEVCQEQEECLTLEEQLQAVHYQLMIQHPVQQLRRLIKRLHRWHIDGSFNLLIKAVSLIRLASCRSTIIY